MGQSIVLDPLDIYRLTFGLRQKFEELLADKLELNVVEGIILPNLQMSGTEGKCAFLNAEGRCSVHAIRPGICRLFPLGRYYDGKSFQYFLQIHECKKENRTKVKVKKWIDTPDLKKNEKERLNFPKKVKKQGLQLTATLVFIQDTNQAPLRMTPGLTGVSKYVVFFINPSEKTSFS